MKLGSMSLSNPLFFPKIVLVILVPLHFLWFLELACHLVQRSQLEFWNKSHWIFRSIRKVLLILKILSLPILRCGMSFHLCRPFFFQWCFKILGVQVLHFCYIYSWMFYSFSATTTGIVFSKFHLWIVHC